MNLSPNDDGFVFINTKSNCVTLEPFKVCE